MIDPAAHAAHAACFPNDGSGAHARDVKQKHVPHLPHLPHSPLLVERSASLTIADIGKTWTHVATKKAGDYQWDWLLEDHAAFVMRPQHTHTTAQQRLGNGDYHLLARRIGR